jgi:GrpB-like predicted nucleotidyltransferase (UPF0157 family)
MKKSRAVVILPYQPAWVDDFKQIARRLRDLVGRSAIRIDNVGATAVPGLGAKDVIDIQITASDLDKSADLTIPLKAAGYRHSNTFQYDVFHNKPETDPELRKLFIRESEGERRVHLHIRELGRFNSATRCCFETIFAHRKMFALNTHSSNAERRSSFRITSMVILFSRTRLNISSMRRRRFGRRESNETG